jgi:membrane protein DedA with SNARE-associated domain
MENAFEWITHYGYAALFLLLLLGILGLPIPDETLLAFTGYLIFKGQLAAGPSLLAAFLGSSCGISASYAIGRLLGPSALSRLGSLLRFSEAHVRHTEAWIKRWGGYAILFGYFVPGVRHVVAIIGGVSLMPFPRFARFAYSGAALWTSCFLALGYASGEEWARLSPLLHRGLVLFGVIVFAVIVTGWLLRRRKFTS